LSHGRWPPPWESGDFEHVLGALQKIATTVSLPEELPSLAEQRSEFGGWYQVVADSEAFVGLGLCSRDWLVRALPLLVDTERHAPLQGDQLVHTDVRSDNICLLPDRTVLVDWDMPHRGNSIFDRAFFAPSLRLEGGPLPEEVVGAQPEFAALVSGFFAARAGLPTIPDAPRVRRIQLRQLRIALPWAARALGLPPPDLPWGHADAMEVDDAYERRSIDRATWHLRWEEIIGDAYLASDDSRAQSGKGGDETEWRWSRELALDALPSGGTVLDVGCANGYLMESFARWGSERGVLVEPYGLEISERLAALARRRLPHWSDRIWTGNVLDWSPPRRFDLVHTGLDYVPWDFRRELVLRLLREFLTPGGRIVLRAEGVLAGQPDLLAITQALGIEVDGVIERVHDSGAVRRTVWIAAR
jgi:SAM-dependent methyltransferase